MEDERQDPPPTTGAQGESQPRRPPPTREGRRGRATRPLDPKRPCLNCGDPTPGEYCPSCGQRKVDVQVSVRTMMADVLEDQLFLDRRLPRTLSALLFKPGQLTVEHVNGRIARHIRPFRLYLVTSVMFFLLVSFLGLQMVRQATANEGEAGGPGGDAEQAVVDSLAANADVAELDSALAALNEAVQDTALEGPARLGLEATREALLRRRADALQGAATDGDTAATPPQTPEGAAPPAPPDLDDGETVAELLWEEGDGPHVSFGIPAVDSALAGRVRRIGRMQPREAAEELASTFLNYTPTMMFVLLPIFALVLKLLYIRRGRFYAEHFVFLLHVHSFVYILATAMLLLRNILPWWFEVGLGGWILVYILLAMRRVYGQGWFRTGLKYWTLGWAYFWIISLSLPFVLLATLLLF